MGKRTFWCTMASPGLKTFNVRNLIGASSYVEFPCRLSSRRFAMSFQKSVPSSLCATVPSCGQFEILENDEAVHLHPAYSPVSSNMAGWKAWTIEISDFPIQTSIYQGDVRAMFHGFGPCVTRIFHTKTPALSPQLLEILHGRQLRPLGLQQATHFWTDQDVRRGQGRCPLVAMLGDVTKEDR